MEISKQITQVINAFPELKYDHKANTLEGTLEVFPNDFYAVFIELDSWNTCFPIVYETGERIPRISDRHVYESEGNCCFTTARMEEILLKTKVKTLQHFIERILIPYLQNNSYYELNKRYINGEYAHSHISATLETYQTLLKIEDPILIFQILFKYFNGIKLTNRHLCYCGSKKTLRKCSNGNHKLGYEQLKFIDKKNLEDDLLVLLFGIEYQNKRNKTT